MRRGAAPCTSSFPCPCGAPVPDCGSTLQEPACCFPPRSSAAIPQPEWLIDRAKLAGRFPPRVRAHELWRIPEPFLARGAGRRDDLAIRAQEDAGLDIVTDGEIRRESYSNRFATALEGVDLDNPGTALDRSGHPNPVPRIVGHDPPQARRRSRRPEVPASAHTTQHDQDHGARARSRCRSRRRTTSTRARKRPRWTTPRR